MPQQPIYITHVICQEPDGIPAKRFVTNTGMLPASFPGASGDYIAGVADTAGAYGESIPVIRVGIAEVEAAGPAGSYPEIAVSGTPPTATLTMIPNGSFIETNALGQAVATSTQTLMSLGAVAPNQYAKYPGDLIEVVLKL